MTDMKVMILKRDNDLQFVSMPETYAYQLTALHQRLHKELPKLTAEQVPHLPAVIAECADLELIDESYTIINGLEYINELEQSFAGIDEKSYPIIALLTEIRALQAQLEQWFEEME